jgi:hypothetical protein
MSFPTKSNQKANLFLFLILIAAIVYSLEYVQRKDRVQRKENIHFQVK